jgi:signal transduction histidine kinase
MEPSMNTPRRRVWTWYAAAWIPLGIFYSMLMARTRAMSSTQAIESGVTYVLPVSLLGVVVWWLSGKITWPPRKLWRFVLVHILLAITFSAVWLGTETLVIAANTGLEGALLIVAQFAGFQGLDGLFFYGSIAAGSYLIRLMAQLRDQQARAARAEVLRMHAELAALRGQLNPHFLFNTLHTLTALVRRDPDTAEHALERFGDMLRYVLDVKRSVREDVTLADELQFVRNYLSLEQLRLGDRLRVIENIDEDATDCVLPSLTLQPLVENAIKYGVAPRARGGSIEIVALLQGESLVLEVRDDGPGARSDIVESATGVGLRAVRQRLETRYPGHAGFSVTTAPGEGFVARVSLPAYSGKESDVESWKATATA